jgi:hypothetical protein
VLKHLTETQSFNIDSVLWSTMFVGNSDTVKVSGTVCLQECVGSTVVDTGGWCANNLGMGCEYPGLDESEECARLDGVLEGVSTGDWCASKLGMVLSIQD